LTVTYTPAAGAAGATLPTTVPASGPATGPARQTVTVYLGSYADLADSTAYAGVPQHDEAYIISGAVYKSLDAPLTKLRDPAITRAPVATATRFTLRRAGQEVYSLTHAAEGWTLHVGKFAVPADATAAADLLHDVANLRAIQFADNVGDPQSIGLAPPAGQIVLTLADGTTETINLGTPETAQAITPVQRVGEPTVYMVQTPDAKEVAPPPETLRSKTVAHFKPADIASLTLAGPAVIEPATLTHAGGATWKLTRTSHPGAAEDADLTKVQTLLGELDGITAQHWLTSPVPSEAPRATLTLEATPAATGPATQQAGPQRPEVQTLRLWYVDAGWVAVLDSPQARPMWPFVPTARLVDALTHTTYAPAPAAPGPGATVK
jgi:hypothetical protein